jgi:hypothetical protein
MPPSPILTATPCPAPRPPCRPPQGPSPTSFCSPPARGAWPAAAASRSRARPSCARAKPRCEALGSAVSERTVCAGSSFKVHPPMHRPLPPPPPPPQPPLSAASPPLEPRTQPSSPARCRRVGGRTPVASAARPRSTWHLASAFSSQRCPTVRHKPNAQTPPSPSLCGRPPAGCKDGYGGGAATKSGCAQCAAGTFAKAAALTKGCVACASVGANAYAPAAGAAACDLCPAPLAATPSGTACGEQQRGGELHCMLPPSPFQAPSPPLQHPLAAPRQRRGHHARARPVHRRRLHRRPQGLGAAGLL